MTKAQLKALINEVILEKFEQQSSFDRIQPQSQSQSKSETIVAKSGQLTKGKNKVNGVVQIQNGFGADVSVVVNDDVPGVIHVYLTTADKIKK